jgi:hypothetical protein
VSIVILGLAALFALLLVGRLGGGYRYELAARWPAMVFAGAAIFMLVRGSIWPAFGLAGLAAIAWIAWPSLSGWRRQRTTQTTAESPKDLEARAILGVGPTATESEIRSAYRAKIAQAHPDRGGSNAEAARLTAARDRLLRKR